MGFKVSKIKSKNLHNGSQLKTFFNSVAGPEATYRPLVMKSLN